MAKTLAGSGPAAAAGELGGYTDEVAAALQAELQERGGGGAAGAAAFGEEAEAAALAGAGSASGRRTLFGEPPQVLIPDGITLRGLAAALGVPAARLEAFLRDQLVRLGGWVVGQLCGWVGGWAVVWLGGWLGGRLWVNWL